MSGLSGRLGMHAILTQVLDQRTRIAISILRPGHHSGGNYWKQAVGYEHMHRGNSKTRPDAMRLSFSD
ncbi:hypothetical protein J6590_070905 [Homalodisca vitripennis]|nr:hypothetical protein J6590_070905 [Homalodisca vitripennis]